MKQVYESYSVFISSPGDVEFERGLAERVIEKINLRVRDTLRAHVSVRKWENLPPITPRLPEERLQEILNREIEKSQFFVLILYKRYGSIEPGYSKSNTEREVDTILDRFKKEPRIKILAYFRELEENADPGEQEVKVRNFRKRLEKEGVVYKTYRTEAEFEERFTHDIYDVVLRIKLSSFKPEQLRRFWQLGDAGNRTGPRVHIIYPSVQRIAVVNGNKDDFWLNRLATQIYFEDYKAIDKVTRSLSSIGFNDWHVNSSGDPPTDLLTSNRVWICVPRNLPGQAQLKKYQERLHFKFVRKTEDSTSNIIWEYQNQRITVKSPLNLYLRKQRESLRTTGEWLPELGRIVAKDFAILARFSELAENDIDEEPLRDYFLAGIRGLGTWGAGWFIDKRYSTFQHIDEKQDVQILLEVHFIDNRIVNVIDVSERPKEYFRNELQDSVVEKHIKNRTLED